MTALVADLRGSAVLGGLFLTILLIAELWARLGKPPAEWTRKFVHLLGGLACALFPLFIRSPLVVAGIGAVFTAVFVWGAQTRKLRSLFAITRATRGSEYYPLAIVLVYIIAYNRYWLFLAAVLVLAVADAGAALVGGRFGRWRYEIEDEQKSVEGSLVFLTLAFTVIAGPLLLLTDLSVAVALLSALLAALLLTGLEGISLRGSDNLFVPFAAVVLLDKITAKPLAEIIFQNVSLLAIAAGVALAARRARAFNTGATLVGVLFTYAAWSLGSWLWALPALTALLVFLLPRGDRLKVRARTLLRAVLPALAVLIIANARANYADGYGPFTAAVAMLLALGGWALAGRWRARTILVRAGFAGFIGAGAWCVTALLPALLQGVGVTVFSAGGGVVTGLMLVHGVSLGKQPRVTATAWTARQFLLTAFAAALVAILQLAELVSVWQP